MATYTSKQASKPANSVGWAGQKITAVGTVILADTRNTATTTTGPQSGDVYRMVRLPQNAVIVGGRFFSSRFGSGTSATSVTAQLNIGFNGAFKDLIDQTSYGATTASQALGALVPLDFAEASVGSVKAESGLNFALGGLLYTLGPLRLTEECFAQVKFSGSVTSFISGSAISLEIDYYMATH
jgi:hypothetical protein